MDKVKELKAEIKELKAELAPLKRNMKVLVEGETRAFHAQLVEKDRQLEWYKKAVEQDKSSRVHAERTARTLADENAALMARVAELSASYASLMGRHASSVRKAGLDARQAKLREQKLQRELSRAEAKGEELAAEAAAAHAAELEAEELLAAAEVQVREAQERADEAVADAEAARDAAAAAEAEVSDASYVEAILTAKLNRANAKAAKLQKEAAERRAEEQRGPKDRSVDEWAALSREAEWKAAQRERLYLTHFLQSHTWRMQDVAATLDELGTP